MGDDKRMGEIRRSGSVCPVMPSEEGTAITDRNKTEVMAKAFAKIHSPENLSEEERRRRERTLTQYPGVVDRKEETGEITDKPFLLEDMIRAINRSRPTSPGID